MLNHASVLVAEDQPFIALDLALAIEDAGGEVVGPVASVREALELLATNAVAAAILDCNLVDGDCSSVVELLAARGIPVIIQTGIGLPANLVGRFPHMVVHIKPCVAAKLIAQLEGLIADHNRSRGSYSTVVKYSAKPMQGGPKS